MKNPIYTKYAQTYLNYLVGLVADLVGLVADYLVGLVAEMYFGTVVVISSTPTGFTL